MKTNRMLLGAAAAALIAAPAAHAVCDADIDGDCSVGFGDLISLLADWGPCPGCDTDLDGDGSVGFSDLLAALAQWGPCAFDYAPPRDDAEAEQIGLELIGPDGPLQVPDDIYERVDRDLDLIRAEFPALASETHTPAWLPDHLIIKKVAGAPDVDYQCLNDTFGVLAEDHLFGDWYVLTFPEPLNVPALVGLYQALDEIEFAEPDGLIGGQNFWVPMPMKGGVWVWEIDDGFHDCFDGCDCHRLYTIEVTEDGEVTLIDYQEFGAPWCEF